MAGSRYLIPTPQYMDTSGRPAVGYKLNSYAGGTTTPLATYSEVTLTTPNTNPVVGDSNGYFGSIFCDPDTAYKFVMTDADDVVIWTQDNCYAGVGSDAIEEGNLADDAVSTAKIVDANVTTAKIADNAVTAAKIADTDAIDATAKIADNIITGAKLTPGTSTIYVSSNDTTEGVLNGKLVADADNPLSLFENTDGGDETLTAYNRLRGCLVYLTSDESVADGATVDIPWDAEGYDTDSMWAIGSPTNIVFSGFSGNVYAVFSGQLHLDPGSNDGQFIVRLEVDDSIIGIPGTIDINLDITVDVVHTVNFTSAPLLLTPSNVVELEVYWTDVAGAAAGAVTVNDPNRDSWMSCHIVGQALKT